MADAGGFYEDIAASYDEAMEGPRTLHFRRAFQELVLAHAEPGGPILDFGCGTGLDVLLYAEEGFPVVAYDRSPAMLSILERRCAAAHKADTVRAVRGDLDDLRAALDRTPAVRTLTANFAVLSHLPRLEPFAQFLCEDLPELTTIVLSVRNPLYVHDLRRRWWWRGLLQTRGSGFIRAPGEGGTRLHFISRIVGSLAPRFLLRSQRSVVRGRTRDRFPLNRMGYLRLLVLKRPP